jgi:energy-converting hydrogenase B subunit D
MITTFRLILLISLVICAIATAIVKKPMQAIIIYMAYSVIMSVIWMLLQSPDLAITEAAVGAGVTGILFFVTLHRINLIDKDAAYDEEMESRRKKDGEGEQDGKREAE